MKINIDNIIIKCLYLVFIATSYASYMPVSIIDDIIIMVVGILLFWKICKEGFSNYNLSIAFVIILLECFWAIISATEYSSNAASFISFIKICILLMVPSYIKLDCAYRNKVLKNFIILSVPNLLLGFWQYYQTQINGIPLEGKYELLEGSYSYRIQGGTGHPLYYAFLMIALVIYFLYNSKFKFRYIMAVLCIALCIYTYSSFALVIVLALVLFKIFLEKQKIVDLLQKHSKTCIILAILVSMVFIYNNMLTEENTIRYVSTMETLNSIDLKTFLTGRGFGSYLDANYSEAYIFRIFYENGIIGLVAMVLILLNLTLVQMRNKNFSGMFICYIYILNLFINEGYIVPFMIFIPIFCSQILGKTTDIVTNEPSNLLKDNIK